MSENTAVNAGDGIAIAALALGAAHLTHTGHPGAATELLFFAQDEFSVDANYTIMMSLAKVLTRHVCDCSDTHDFTPVIIGTDGLVDIDDADPITRFLAQYIACVGNDDIPTANALLDALADDHIQLAGSQLLQMASTVCRS